MLWSLGFSVILLYQLENYNAFYDLYGQLKEIEGVEQVVSILQARKMKKNEALKSFDFKPVTSQRYERQKQVDSVAKELSSLPFYTKIFYNDKNKSHLMALTLNKELLDNESRIDLILSIEDVLNPFAEQIGVDVHYSGLPYIRTKSTVKTKAEVEMFIFLAMGVTAFIMLLFSVHFPQCFIQCLLLV